MEKLLSILVLTLLSCTLSAQYVHQIKADSVRIHNDSCKAELILENSTKNISGFLYNKGNGRTEFRKLFTKSGDSLLFAGGDTVKLDGNAILNQYTKKQVGNFWIDTSRSIRFLLSDTISNSILDLNGNSGTIIKLNDKYPYKGLQSSVGAYNAPGNFIEFSAVADSGSKFRRNTVGVFEKGIVGSIGQTYWGDNSVWPTSPAFNSRGYYVFKFLPSKTITLSGNKDFPNAGTMSSYAIGMQSTGNDTGYIQTGWGQGAAINHFFRYDVFPWNPENVRHKGQYINAYSYLDMSNKNGSYVESFVDYYAGGQNNYNSGQRLKQKVNFYAANDQYGYTDRNYGFYQEGSGKLNYIGGKLLIKDSSVLNADTYDFYNGGTSKFAGNIVQTNGRTILGGNTDDAKNTLQVLGTSRFEKTVTIKNGLDYNTLNIEGYNYYPTLNFINVAGQMGSVVGYNGMVYESNGNHWFRHKGINRMFIYSNAITFQKTDGTEAARVTGDGKLQLNVVGEYADNAAAKAAGLPNGTIYRTGDLLKIVHD